MTKNDANNGTKVNPKKYRKTKSSFSSDYQQFKQFVLRSWSQVTSDLPGVDLDWISEGVDKVGFVSVWNI